MRVPEKNYSLSSFLEYIATNTGQVFGKEDVNKWLKIYMIYASDRWKELLNPHIHMQLGEIYHIRIPARSSRSKTGLQHTIPYYMHELTPGLLMFFSSSRESDYEDSLRHFINTTRGLGEMWITPSSFEKIKSQFLNKYNARIYRFIARRNQYTTTLAAKLRPDIDRRLSYTGKDATEVLKETAEMYGISPTSIDFSIGPNTFEVTNDGLFLVRSVNADALEVMIDIIKSILAEQVLIRKTSQKVESHTTKIKLGEEEVSVPTVSAGIIKLLNVSLEGHIINHLLGYKEKWERVSEEEKAIKGFSFVDVSLREDPSSFSATAVDEMKGTVFGISGGEREIVLVPKHRTTFESYIRFYREISELIDFEASFNPYGELDAR